MTGVFYQWPRPRYDPGRPARACGPDPERDVRVAGGDKFDTFAATADPRQREPWEIASEREDG